ncbi:MAG: ribbon-helix-helix protein, CopG family [Acidobacteria bacterium]|nr:ribbon-helix-helix protein, CopG family [Acidobacteriota bacterium]
MRKNYDFRTARRGAVVQQPATTRVSVHLDNELLERLRERADATGRGYQAMISEAILEHLERSERWPLARRTEG